MAFTSIFALGLVSQSVFFGGNVAISGMFIPVLRNSQLAPSSQIKIWEKLFLSGAQWMVPAAVASAACYLYEAYYAVDDYTRRTMLVSGGLSISVLLFTRIVMFPGIRNLRGLVQLSDAELISKNFGSGIDNWNKLSIVRALISSAGFANALWYQIAKP